MPELTTVPSDTPVLTDKVWFNDLSETPDAINQCELTALQTLLSPTLASTTEVLTGTDTAKATTPNAIAALWEKGSDIASAATITVGEGGFFHITGTTGPITDIDPGTDKAGRAFWLIFDSTPTLTHHATTLILPTGGNITAVAGDAALFISEGSDAVRCVLYRGRYASITTSGNIHAGNIISYSGYMSLGVTGSTPRVDSTASNIVRWLDPSAVGTAHLMFEMTAPAAPAANTMHLWVQDNGAGKTQLMVRFGSGAAIQIAIEP